MGQSLKDVVKIAGNADSVDQLAEIILGANSIGYDIKKEDIEDHPISFSLTLGYANIKKVEEQRLINEEEVSERAKESLRCAELGEKLYVRTILEEHKENHTLFKTSSFESLVCVFENAFNSKMYNLTETDWDDVYSSVAACGITVSTWVLNCLERYKNPQFAAWAVEGEKMQRFSFLVGI